MIPCEFSRCKKVPTYRMMLVHTTRNNLISWISVCDVCLLDRAPKWWAKNKVAWFMVDHTCQFRPDGRDICAKPTIHKIALVHEDGEVTYLWICDDCLAGCAPRHWTNMKVKWEL